MAAFGEISSGSPIGRELTSSSRQETTLCGRSSSQSETQRPLFRFKQTFTRPDVGVLLSIVDGHNGRQGNSSETIFTC